jgi:arginine decarboxylase
MAEVAYRASRHPPRAYNSVWQLRVDTWSSIADVTKRLSDATLPQDQRAALEGDLGQLLNLVAPVETYWAHPGPQRFGQLRKVLAAREYEPAGSTVDAIIRRLVGEPTPADLGVPSGRADDHRAGQLVSEEPRRVRPSFEVLVVGDVTGQEADQLRAELRRLQRPEDMFGYELVFVPSFEDALVAVQLNFNLQACIIRPEFQLRSQVDLHDIHHFLPQMDKQGIEQRSVVERVRLLGEGIAELRPETWSGTPRSRRSPASSARCSTGCS